MEWMRPIVLLLVSNVFMTYAWYGHLRDAETRPLWMAIAFSWGVALLEYCFMIPANRYGSEVFTLPQLKILQEVITMVVFGWFSVVYMDIPISRNYVYAGLCLLGAVYFIFKDRM